MHRLSPGFRTDSRVSHAPSGTAVAPATLLQAVRNNRTVCTSATRCSVASLPVNEAGAPQDFRVRLAGRLVVVSPRCHYDTAHQLAKSTHPVCPKRPACYITRETANKHSKHLSSNGTTHLLRLQERAFAWLPTGCVDSGAPAGGVGTVLLQLNSSPKGAHRSLARTGHKLGPIAHPQGHIERGRSQCITVVLNSEIFLLSDTLLVLRQNPEPAGRGTTFHPPW